MIRLLFSTIWIPEFVYMVLPAITVILGCSFIVASIMVSSQLGLLLSTIITIYGSLIIAIRHGY